MAAAVSSIEWNLDSAGRAPDFICVCRRGWIDYISPAGVGMLGYDSHADLIGQPLSRFLLAESSPLLAAWPDGDMPHGLAQPVTLLGGDGRRIDVDMVAYPIVDLSGGSLLLEARLRPMIGSLRDTGGGNRPLAVTADGDCLSPAVADRLRLADAIFESSAEAIVVLDRGFLITAVNPAFFAITGFSEAEVKGRHPTFLDVVTDSASLSEVLETIHRTGRWDQEQWGYRKSGEEFAKKLSILGVAADDGVITQYVAVFADVTQRKYDEERIRYQANYDGLTGLPNRSLFMDRLRQSLRQAERLGQRVGLMYIDLDGFKLVNDTLGHQVGDDLLKEAARRLLSCVRHGDTVARLGGDEFSIILPDPGENGFAPAIAQRMIEALEQPFLLSDREAFISASIGITVFPEDAADAQSLLKNADAAMYRAKERGKANFHFYTADINAEVSERLVIKNGLSKALDRGEFTVYYQPKCNLATGRLTGVEALLRWRTENLGMMSPDKFIPVMEETGLIGVVGEWVLETACLQHRRWRDEGHPEMRVAVNLSVRQLNADLPRTVQRVLDRTGISPAGLELEITESMIMRDSENAVAVLQALSDMGIRLAMDDFGTGYSSLSYLKRFPVHTIKIDRSFIADIATDPDDQEIIRTIISMGHSLRRRIVAEGVETEEQRVLLRKLRCDEMQGYLLSPPVPAAEIDRLLSSAWPGKDGLPTPA